MLMETLDDTRGAPANRIPNVGPAGASLPAGARQALFILFAISTCNFVDRYIMGLLLEPIRREFGLSDSSLAGIATVPYAIAYALAAIPAGMLVDRFSRKAFLGWMLVGWSATTALCGAASNLAALVVLRGAVGATESASQPASLSIVADTVPPHRRATVSGVLFLASPLALLLSFSIGGWVAQTYGWRTAFVLAGAPGLVLAVMLAFWLREPPRGRFDTKTGVDPLVAAPIGASLRWMGGQPALLAVAVGMMVLAMSAASVNAWVTSLLVRTYGFDLRQAGMFAACLSCCGILLGAVGNGALADRLASRDRRWPLWLCAFTAAAAMTAGIGMTYGHVLWVTAVAMTAYFAFASAHVGVSFGFTITAAPAGMRGTVVASQQILMNLVGFGLGPLLTGVLSDMLGGGGSLRVALMATMSVNLLGVLAYLFAASRLPRLVTQAPEPLAATG